jgi:hypothetical protein
MFKLRRTESAARARRQLIAEEVLRNLYEEPRPSSAPSIKAILTNVGYAPTQADRMMRRVTAMKSTSPKHWQPPS